MDHRIAIQRAFVRYSRLAGAKAIAALLGLGLLLVLVRLVDREIAPQDLEAAQVDGTTWSDWLAALEISPGPGDQPVVWSPSRPEFDSVRALDANDAEPALEEEDSSRFIGVEITGYTSHEEETDADPFLTAMCTTTGPGVIALSRDLLETFTPGAPFDFGDKVLLPGVGIYRIEDTMHSRWRKKADIWFSSQTEAANWGRRKVYMTKVDDQAPLFPLENPVAQNF